MSDSIKNKLIELSTETILSKGYRELRMDALAKQLSISKKTIYKFFKSKKELILANYDFQMKFFEKMMKDRVGNELNAIEKFLTMENATLEKISLERRRENLLEVRKSYGGWVYKYMIEESMILIMRLMGGILVQGKEEGLFTEQIENHKLMSRLYANSYMNLMLTKEIKTEEERELARKYCIYTFFNGISTDRGREELKKIDLI